MGDWWVQGEGESSVRSRILRLWLHAQVKLRARGQLGGWASLGGGRWGLCGERMFGTGGNAEKQLYELGCCSLWSLN